MRPQENKRKRSAKRENSELNYMKMLDAFAERKSYKLVMKNASLDQGADHKTFAARRRRRRRQLGQNLAKLGLFVALPRRRRLRD